MGAFIGTGCGTADGWGPFCGYTKTSPYTSMPDAIK